jgi:hypothetical protein
MAQAFMGKFKIAEQSATSRKSQNVLTPLLYEVYNPYDQTK